MGEPDPSKPDEGVLEVCVQCGSTDDKRAVDAVSAELTEMLNRMLNSTGAFDFKSLCIVPGRFCWRLYLDIHVLRWGGSLLDITSFAAFAALGDTRLPKLHVIDGFEGDKDYEIDDDPANVVSLDLSHMPLSVTLLQIGTFFVADASPEEEQVRRQTDGSCWTGPTALWKSPSIMNALLLTAGPCFGVFVCALLSVCLSAPVW